MNMKDGKEGRDMDLSKCGSYMASENTMPKHIPSFKDWQKSVSSMLDNSCVTKPNFDGMVNETKLPAMLQKRIDMLDTTLLSSNVNLTKQKLISYLTPIITAIHNAVASMSSGTEKSTMIGLIKKIINDAETEEKEEAEAEKSKSKTAGMGKTAGMAKPAMMSKGGVMGKPSMMKKKMKKMNKMKKK